MQTRDIPREQWIRFFDDFSKNHEGWIVTLEVLGADIGDQEEANNLPLVGISADVKARENRVEIIIGGRPDVDLTRFIERPKHIWVKEPRVPGDEAMEIESEDGIKTILNFHRIRPEETERQLPAGA
ncbi:MAG TPA: DUF5335 family protein [Blastocatellia bacterium]|jgi:Family of unknown function (DUF5335)|nr:DUF5335 family protein [Blastocatellia bacterium]